MAVRRLGTSPAELIGPGAGGIDQHRCGNGLLATARRPDSIRMNERFGAEGKPDLAAPLSQPAQKSLVQSGDVDVGHTRLKGSRRDPLRLHVGGQVMGLRRRDRAYRIRRGRQLQTVSQRAFQSRSSDRQRAARRQKWLVSEVCRWRCEEAAADGGDGPHDRAAIMRGKQRRGAAGAVVSGRGFGFQQNNPAMN